MLLIQDVSTVRKQGLPSPKFMRNAQRNLRKKCQMSLHTFVDESKFRSYVLAGATCPTSDLAATRRLLTNLLLPGQERLHFSKERDARRRLILQQINDSPLRAVIVTTPKKPTEIEARARALRRLVRETQVLSIHRLVIERDESALILDKRVLSEATANAHARATLSYGWSLPHQEPLLWAADAFAWAWSAGGKWRDQVRSGVNSISISLP